MGGFTPEYCAHGSCLGTPECRAHGSCLGWLEKSPECCAHGSCLGWLEKSLGRQSCLAYSIVSGKKAEGVCIEPKIGPGDHALNLFWKSIP